MISSLFQRIQHSYGNRHFQECRLFYQKFALFPLGLWFAIPNSLDEKIRRFFCNFLFSAKSLRSIVFPQPLNLHYYEISSRRRWTTCQFVPFTLAYMLAVLNTKQYTARNVAKEKQCRFFNAGEQKASPQTIFGQRHSINEVSNICPHSWDTCVLRTNMHVMWPRRPWY